MNTLRTTLLMALLTVLLQEPARQDSLPSLLDDVESTQLVVHAPFGGRVNRALGLALRKRFCVTFDFELQAAADDDERSSALVRALEALAKHGAKSKMGKFIDESKDKPFFLYVPYNTPHIPLAAKEELIAKTSQELPKSA